jgi:hypothetical protein
MPLVAPEDLQGSLEAGGLAASKRFMVELSAVVL